MRLPHKVVFSTLILFLLTLGTGHCFQVSGGGGTVKFVQSGNPGTSATFTVASTVRIEGRGVVLENNEGAVDWDAVEAAEAAANKSGGGSSARFRQIVNVCEIKTGKKLKVIPTGSDDLMNQYKTCVDESRDAASCAMTWALAKGYVAENECDRAEPVPSTPLKPIRPAVEEDETEFKFSAPEKPKEPVAPETVTPEPAETPVETDLPTPINVPTFVPSLKTDFLLGAGQAAALSFPGVDSETLDDFKFAAEKTYYSCINVPVLVSQNPWWKWLAMRLFMVFVCLVIIIFLLAFWVFLLWRQQPPKKRKSGKQKSWWAGFKKKWNLRL